MAISIFTKLPPVARQVFKTGAIAGGLGVLGYCAKPFVLAEQHYFADPARKDVLDPALEARLTVQRRQNFETAIFNQYVRQGSGKIDWYQFADIVDFVARNTPSDEAFRKDIWYLFGWREKGVRAPLAEYLDSENRGLPKTLHNTGSVSEQMHHYLGGTTGNTDKIPSHLKNNRLYAFYYEFKDFLRRGTMNWGDVRLFNLAQKHRDDFLKNGRFVVARNIRAILEPPSSPGAPLQPFMAQPVPGAGGVHAPAGGVGPKQVLTGKESKQELP
jgi:hypothetical protein